MLSEGRGLGCLTLKAELQNSKKVSTMTNERLAQLDWSTAYQDCERWADGGARSRKHDRVAAGALPCPSHQPAGSTELQLNVRMLSL